MALTKRDKDRIRKLKVQRIAAKKKLDEARQVVAKTTTPSDLQLDKVQLLLAAYEHAKAEEKLAVKKPVVRKPKTKKEPVTVVEDPLQEVIAEDTDVIFKPNPGPQTDFLRASERQVLYGGGAGSGKSFALLADALRYAGISDHRAIIFRRTNDQLRELIFKSKTLYPRAFEGAKWSEQKHTWIFPSGAEIWFTYLDRDDDVLRYHGQAFNYIAFDELGQWSTPYPWEYMASRLRTTNPNLPLTMRATANPGGPGGWWVKKMFVDPATPGEPFWATDLDTGQIMCYTKGHSKEGQPLFRRKFIPALLADNPYLASDGQYEASLMALPEHMRKQLLEGDWDVVEGVAFPEFNPAIHVINPFAIPASWSKFRATDWGYAEEACTLWMAIDQDKNIYVYREYCDNGKAGKHRVTGEEYAANVFDYEQEDIISYGEMDSSVWSNRGDSSPSIAEQMNKVMRNLNGVVWRKADRSSGSVLASKMLVHTYLKVDEITNKPKLFIFNNCVNLIKCLKTLPLDKNNNEEVDTKAYDHPYDALRYGLMSRPHPSKQPSYSDDFRRREIQHQTFIGY